MTTAKSQAFFEATRQFHADLDKVIAAVRGAAVAQFNYNLESRVRTTGGLRLEFAGQQAIVRGITAGWNAYSEFSCDAAITLAHSVLEDANCHREAKALIEEANRNGIFL